MPTCAPTLASHGLHRLENKSPLLEMLCTVLGDTYNAETNPDGVVSLGVAENSLCLHELKTYYDCHLNLSPDDFSYGLSLKGSRRLHAALNNLYRTRFGSIWDIKEDQMITASGVGALIDQLTALLCDRGDAVLLARPLYSGFVKDLQARNGALCAGVEITARDPSSPATLADFQIKLNELKTAGIKTRAIILCNPHNPLGFNYPRETVVAYARFAEQNDLFLISDEIYALSVYDSDLANAAPFCSILSIDVQNEAGCDPRRIIHLYGASKDWGINGFRIGAMSTVNQDVLDTFTSAAMWLKLSSPADALFSALLNDEKELDKYLEMNQRRLGTAYAYATRFLKLHGIPYMPSSAGHFVMIDLRRFLPDRDQAGQVLATDAQKEAALFLRLLDNGVYLAPAAFYQNPEAGWFRLTFSVIEATIQVGLDRLAKALKLVDGTSGRKRLDSGNLDMSSVAEVLGSSEMACCAVCS